MERQTLRDWVHRYNAEGVDGLADRPRPGSPPRLGADDGAAFDRIVDQGPDVDGVVRWRYVDLAAVLADRFAVELYDRSVGRLLNRRRFRRLVPRPRHPKADEAAQAALKKASRRSKGARCCAALAASRSRSGSRMKPASVKRAR